MRDIIMVSSDAVDNEWMLAVTRRYFDTKLHVRAFMLVREHFPHVVQQRSATRHRDIESELRGHDSGKPRNFLRVMQDVLPVARPPSHAADELDDLLMQAVNSAGIRGTLASVDDSRIHLFARFSDDFLDTTGMNATI